MKMQINNYLLILIGILSTWNVGSFRHSCFTIKMTLNPMTPELLYQKLADKLLYKSQSINIITEKENIEEKQLQLQTQDNYLSTIEWKNINYILNHNDSTPELRDKVKNIIYNYYENWAFSMVNLIKNKHWEKCGAIQLDELKLYAYIGLRKALINYDSTKYNQFTNYAIKYVYSEIFSGIYELTPIYASDENYKYKNKQKVFNRKCKNKHNETRRQKSRSNNFKNENNIIRKKIALVIEE